MQVAGIWASAPTGGFRSCGSSRCTCPGPAVCEPLLAEPQLTAWLQPHDGGQVSGRRLTANLTQGRKDREVLLSLSRLPFLGHLISSPGQQAAASGATGQPQARALCPGGWEWDSVCSGPGPAPPVHLEARLGSQLQPRLSPHPLPQAQVHTRLQTTTVSLGQWPEGPVPVQAAHRKKAVMGQSSVWVPAGPETIRSLRGVALRRLSGLPHAWPQVLCGVSFRWSRFLQEADRKQRRTSGSTDWSKITWESTSLC